MFSFFKPTVNCPRCLGKGHVDLDDIKRLGQELRWNPGPCAYCNGKGKVTANQTQKVAADNAYLTNDIGQHERARLFLQDEGALHRAKMQEKRVKDFVAQIEYLYHMGKMNAEMIADFYLIGRADDETAEQEKLELIDYINRVINKKK